MVVVVTVEVVVILARAVGGLGGFKAKGRSACMNLKLRTLYQRRDTVRGSKSARLSWAQP